MGKNIVKGDELQLFLNDGAPKWATSHTLNLSGSSLDRATKDDGFWGSNEVGKLTWDLTAECLYSDGDYDKMFTMFISHVPVTVKFANVKNYSVNGLTSVGGDVAAWIPADSVKEGRAYVTSLTATANTGENATYSITFTGAGPLIDKSNYTTNYVIEIVYGDGNASGTVFPAGQPVKLFNKSNKIAGYKLTDATNLISAQQMSSDVNIYTPVANTNSFTIELYIKSSEIPENLFRDIQKIRYATVGSINVETGFEDFEKPSGAMFAESENLESVILGANIKGLSYRTFAGCTNLEDVFMYFVGEDDEQNPVGVGLRSQSLAFPAETFESLTIHVPAEIKSWYEAHDLWSHVASIEELQ